MKNKMPKMIGIQLLLTFYCAYNYAQPCPTCRYYSVPLLPS
jgi:hypothetical protein